MLHDCSVTGADRVVCSSVLSAAASGKDGVQSGETLLDLAGSFAMGEKALEMGIASTAESVGSLGSFNSSLAP